MRHHLHARRISCGLGLGAFVLILAFALALPDAVSAQTPDTIAARASSVAPLPTLATTDNSARAVASETARDGAHDFDFLLGTWNARLKRLVKPLTGSTEWVEFEGTQITSRIWDGRGTMDVFTVDSPGTKTRIDGLTIRLYNPVAKQWNIYWANAKDGTFGVPTVGVFSNGRGEFYDQEDYEGRKIFVRYVWSDITPNSAKFEQSFSIDGGKTWEPNWISTVERAKP